MNIKVIKIKPEFIDNRGFISRVIDEEGLVIKSVLYIERKAGAITANHYHKKDTHFIYCLKGKIKYSEKKSQKEDAVTVTIHPGEMVRSSPRIPHSTEFLEDTIFLTFSTQHRNQEQYESDTVRVNYFDSK